jgi:hypothetical protein
MVRTGLAAADSGAEIGFSENLTKNNFRPPVWKTPPRRGGQIRAIFICRIIKNHYICGLFLKLRNNEEDNSSRFLPSCSFQGYVK